MKKEKSYTMLIPKYMQQFSCIGSDCEDTCCSGWGVSIDKKTYKKYNKVKNIELKSLFKENIVRNKQSTIDTNYAKIKITTTGCPFLDEEKLCRIQLNLGEDYLSQTCSVYPRRNNLVDGTIEQSAETSCPEIARLVLLNREKMEFDQIDASNKDDVRVSRNINTKKNMESKSIEKYFWEIRMFSVNLLQNRNYTISERLIILGLFIENINNLVLDGRESQIKNTIVSYNLLIEERLSITNELDLISNNVNIQIDIIKSLIVKKGYFNNYRFIECLAEMIEGLKLDETDCDEQLINNYNNAYNSYYKPFMDKNEHILENYLVNYIFKNLFPIYRQKGIFDDYMLLITHYAMIKLVLIGMSNFHQGLNEKLVVKLIQSFSKTVEHSNSYLEETIKFMSDSEITTMNIMSALIKN
jgi:lysine-N-methylase